VSDAIKKPNDTVPRGAGGRFAKGCKAGPGRKPGTKNAATGDLRAIKAEFVDSWTRCHGAEILDSLAKLDPNRWLALIAGLLPKDVVSDMSITQLADPLNMNAPGAEPDPVRDEFYEQLQTLADGGPITSATVMAQLEHNKRSRNGWRSPAPLGVDHGNDEETRNTEFLSDA